jgi:CheY-like chemotaxis protein
LVIAWFAPNESAVAHTQCGGSRGSAKGVVMTAKMAGATAARSAARESGGWHAAGRDYGTGRDPRAEPATEGSRMARVLVVEDEESFSDALSYILRKKGFDVAVCPTGLSALDTFDRSGADLVLLDLMFPGPASTEVITTLRKRSNVPVIMLTAGNSEADEVFGLELGADDCVTKPFSGRELVTRIRALLDRQAGIGEPQW